MKRKPSFMFRLAYGTMQRAYNIGGDGLVRVAAGRLAEACNIGYRRGNVYDSGFFQGLGRGVCDATGGKKCG